MNCRRSYSLKRLGLKVNVEVLLATPRRVMSNLASVFILL
jgi:hypothetical protein